MTILDSINYSQTLLQQLLTQDDVNAKVKESLSALQIELDTVSSQAHQLIDELVQLRTQNQSTNQQQATLKRPEMESGCYVFEGEKGFFCPLCYDNYDKKVATARINKKLRVCPACRTSIK